VRHRGPFAAARHRARASEERSLTELHLPRLLGSFPRADVTLDPPLPAVAFLGRSNVGKSSLLNALLGRRIARVSGTPGKTRMLNVYLVTLGTPPASRTLYFLDLPGYGYARAGRSDRAAFRRLVTGALARKGLAGVVWLLDLRREPSDDDLAMQDLLAAGGTHVLAAFTKCDKLPSGQRLARERALVARMALAPDQSISTSVRTGDGVDDLRAAIAALVQEEAE
jgi:GTP-binding protein